VVISVKAPEKGEYSVTPRIVFIDSQGVYNENDTDPVTLKIGDMQTLMEKMLSVRKNFQEKDSMNGHLY
jgi:hypothetical protein